MKKLLLLEILFTFLFLFLIERCFSNVGVISLLLKLNSLLSFLITKLLSYDKNGDDTVKDVSTIDYSDVVKYSNWMKNVE